MWQFLEKRVHWALMLPALLLLVGLTSYPVLYTGILALSRYNLVRPWVPHGFLGPGNFVAFLSDTYLWRALWVTFKFGFATVSIEIVLGFLVAWLLQQKLRGSSLFRIIYLIPMMVVPVVAGLVWRLMLNPNYGIVNWAISRVGLEPRIWLGSDWALPSVIVTQAWQWIPFSVLIFTVALVAIPKEYYEAADVDGASPWFTFRHITLPNLRWAIMIVSIFKLSDAIKAFDVIYIMTGGGPGVITQTLAQYIKRVGFTDFEMGYAAATSFLLLLISFAVLFPVIRRVGANDAQGKI